MTFYEKNSSRHAFVGILSIQRWPTVGRLVWLSCACGCGFWLIHIRNQFPRTTRWGLPPLSQSYS
jgi:hypothetical protein